MKYIITYYSNIFYVSNFLICLCANETFTVTPGICINKSLILMAWYIYCRIGDLY